MNYHRKVNRRVYARIPVRSEYESKAKKVIHTVRSECKDWNFTGCKNERWLKFIDERISW